MELNQIYRPLTAAPFSRDIYIEAEPCAPLKPFIRCFWGTPSPYRQVEGDAAGESLIVPDTCMNIIFNINYTENNISNRFCGIDNASFRTGSMSVKDQYVSTFAICFYAWTAVLFSEESMSDVKNAFFDVGVHFSKLKRELEPLLFEITDMKERIRIAEKFLLESLHLERKNHIVNDGVAEMIQRKGNITMSSLAKEIHVSNRQIERVFKENIGVSPKQLTSLIRYQCLWRDVLFKRDFNILDEVSELGFMDQAHLLNNFKRYHTMSLSQAKEFALKDVAFLQDNLCQ